MNVGLPYRPPNFPSVLIETQIIEWAFGKRMTPAERLRKHQRALEKTQRELDRERVKLENQEKKLVQDIKKSAKNGQIGACKIQAKDLVRTRRYIGKFYSMRTQLQAISLRIQVIVIEAAWMRGMLTMGPDRPKQRTDDGIDEGRHTVARKHEPSDESARLAANRDGIRA